MLRMVSSSIFSTSSALFKLFSFLPLHHLHTIHLINSQQLKSTDFYHMTFTSPVLSLFLGANP